MNKNKRSILKKKLISYKLKNKEISILSISSKKRIKSCKISKRSKKLIPDIGPQNPIK